MVLNPFTLLGVTIHSTCQEVRKRYYELACLCHPDRGGTNEQMQMLHNAYRYVIEQVSLNRTVTFEQLEAEFADFCAQQTQVPPPFRAIHNDAFNLPEFNDLFDKSTVIDGAFAEGGYSVVPSEAGEAYDARPDDQYVEPFQAQLVVYEEPRAQIMPHASLRDVTGAPLDDYSVRVGYLYPSDYREGLAAAAPLHGDSPDACVPDAFDRELALREYEK